jgi:hypothetical protein
MEVSASCSALDKQRFCRFALRRNRSLVTLKYPGAWMRYHGTTGERRFPDLHQETIFKVLLQGALYVASSII